MSSSTHRIVSELGDNRGRKPQPEYDEALQVCKDHPGEWVLVKESTTGAGRRAMESRGCTTRRKHHNGKVQVWARWENKQ